MNKMENSSLKHDKTTWLQILFAWFNLKCVHLMLVTSE